MSVSADQGKQANQSIVTDAMRKLGIRVALVIVAVTTVTYFHVINTIENQSLEQLDKYISERAKNESSIFQFVKDGHENVRAQLLERLEADRYSDPKSRFYGEVERFADGVTRTRLHGFDGKKESFIYIGKQVRIDAGVRRKVMLFLDISNQYGPAWNHRLEDFYFTTPDNILVGYWPSFPNWAHAAPADLYIPDEEYAYVADMKHNPERKTVWTGLYYDEPSDHWLVSTETPVDYQGKPFATIGSDITLDQLMDRTINNRLAGTYNLILRKDGRVIAHPMLMDEIKKKKGHYEITESSDQHLQSIYQLVRKQASESTVLHNTSFNEVLAVRELDGPGWYFITVYPQELISATAASTARIVLLLGVLSLVIELIILYWVMTNNVARPLLTLVKAVDQVADGNHDIELPKRRRDELGQISEAVESMAQKVEARTQDLIKSQEELEHTVEARTKELQDAQESLIKKERLAILGQLTATVSHELRNPLAAILSSIYVLKSNVDRDSAAYQKALERVQRNTKRCDNIIDELLDFTRSSDLEIECHILEFWLDRILDDLEFPHDIRIEKNYETGNTVVNIDPNRMQRAVTNVVVNAYQSMLDPEGVGLAVADPLLSIRCWSDHANAYISVTDTGQGMSEEIQQKIFEPLFSTKGFGVGLGMTVIRQIMEQHGGDIEVKSEPERGTTITLRIPLNGQESKGPGIARRPEQHRDLH